MEMDFIEVAGSGGRPGKIYVGIIWINGLRSGWVAGGRFKNGYGGNQCLDADPNHRIWIQEVVWGGVRGFDIILQALNSYGYRHNCHVFCDS